MSDMKESTPLENLRNNAENQRRAASAYNYDRCRAEERMNAALQKAEEYDRAADLLEAAMKGDDRE